MCPACGSNVEGDLCLGCPSCGARAVGPPLAKAEHELPAYGRAVIAASNGAVMSAGFLAAAIVALAENKGAWLRFWTIVNAGEVAAWRLKWVAFPVAIGVLWSGARMIGGIKKSGGRFAGLRAARIGFVASIVVTAMIATLIGMTIPVRLQRRQWAIDAAVYARAYTLHRALLQYRELKGTLPTDIRDLGDKSILSDPDGSIAEALRYVDSSAYQAAGPMLASVPTKAKPLALRGGALRNAAANTNADPPGVSFTNYELHLSGEHRLFSTDDDFIVRDGVVTKTSETPPSSASAHTGTH